MIRDFVYKIKLTIQHKLYGTVKYISKDFDASIELNESDYYNNFVVNSEDVLKLMTTAIDQFLFTEKYNRNDIDIVSYEVTTEDPYVNIRFTQDETTNKYTINPEISAFITPENLLPDVPLNFNGTVVSDGTIEWTWDTAAFCAYRIYDENNKLIAEAPIDSGLYMEVRLKKGENYTRRLVAFNAEGESDPTEYRTVNVPADVVFKRTPMKELSLKDMSVNKLESVEKKIERLGAFKSGIGDNLDLLTVQANEMKVSEKFKFDIILEGTIKGKKRRYTAINFNYQIIATGNKRVHGTIDTTAVVDIKPWVTGRLNIDVLSYIYNPLVFSYRCFIDVKYTHAGIGSSQKTMEFTGSSSIESPVDNHMLKDIGSFLRSDYDISSADSYQIEGFEVSDISTVDVQLSLVGETIRATCLKSDEFYEASEKINRKVNKSIDDKVMIFDAGRTPLTNKSGQVYAGDLDPKASIRYNTTDDNVVLLSERGDRNPVKIEGIVPNIYATVSDIYESRKVSLLLDEVTKRKTINAIEEMPYLVGGIEYTFEITPASNDGKYSVKIGNVEEQYADVIYMTAMLETYTNIEFAGTPKLTYLPWVKESQILSDVVNGTNSGVINDEGKKSLVTTAPVLNPPSDVDDVVYEVRLLLSAGNKPIDFGFRDGFEYNKTRIDGDILTFASDYYEYVDTMEPWTGPMVRTEEFELTTPDAEKFSAYVYNPISFDENNNDEVSNVIIKVRSTNPNVIVEPLEKGVINFEAISFKRSFEFIAKIVSPTQNSWAPEIHPGYYYINNDEYFLFANPHPLGQYAVREVPRVKEFFVTIKAGVESESSSGIRRVEYKSKSSLERGVAHQVEIAGGGKLFLKEISKPGEVIKYHENGYYQTDLINFPQSIPALRITWDQTDPVRCEILPKYENGSIGTWLTVMNDVQVTFPFLANDFRVRYTFERLKKMTEQTHEVVDFKKAFFDQTKESSSNIKIMDAMLKLDKEAERGYYYSPVVEVDESAFQEAAIEALTNKSGNSGEYRVYVASSNNKDDVSDVNDIHWRDITNTLGEYIPAGRYLRYMVDISAGSDIVFYRVTRTYRGRGFTEYSPIVSDIALETTIPDWSFAGNIYKTLLCRLPLDTNIHDMTENSVFDVIYSDILQSGVTKPRLTGVEITTLDETVMLYYSTDGSDKLKAASIYEETYKTKSEYLTFNVNMSFYLTPIPQLGRPVVFMHDVHGPLKQVSFMDDQGKITLTNTETLKSDGRSVIVLGYDHIDIGTLVVKCEGKDLEIDKMVDNTIYLVDYVERGKEINISYKILNTFNIDYNEFQYTERARAIVHLSNSEDEDYSVIKAFYETNDEDSWYYAKEIELNPLYSDLSTSFIYLTDEEMSATDMTITMTPEVFDASGVDSAFLYVKLTDENGNAVPDAPIKLSTDKGDVLVVDSITNKFGIVVAKYTAPKIACVDNIVAKCDLYDIKATKRVIAKAVASEIHLGLTSSSYEVQDGEKVEISAKVFYEDLTPCLSNNVILQMNDEFIEVVVKETKATNSSGVAVFTVIPMVNSGNDICKITVSAGDAEEEIEIKVVR